MPAQHSHQLQHIIFAESDILAERQSSKGKLAVVQLLDVEAVLCKDVEVVSHSHSLARRQVKRLRPQQRLFVQHGGRSQTLEVKLLIRRVLIDDEEVLPQTSHDEAQVELADDVHAWKVGLVEHSVKLLGCGCIVVICSLCAAALQVMEVLRS